MTRKFFTMPIAMVLIAALLAPSLFLSMPQQVFAAYPVVETGPNLATNIKTTIESTISAVQNTITAIATPITAAATLAQQVNTYVLQPLAFVLSGNLLKSITASVLGFVLGKSNGTGSPQFITDLRGSLQTVGDTQALAFFSRLRSLNSPFAASVTSSLTANYLQNTSVGGFFAANQCTLAKSSPNIQSFLAGDWSQGGVKTWFALTTQNQNNPYTLYLMSQSELATLVNQAETAKVTEWNWGQGFTSWCGNSSSASIAGDPCTKKDGTSGIIQTPGSFIKAALDRAMGTDQAKLVQMGSVAKEINSIMGNIGSIMGTANLAFSLFGGSSGYSGGLLGISGTSAANRNSLFSQYQNTPGYLGVTPINVYQNATTMQASGSVMSDRIVQYRTSWDTIAAAANTASTSAASLANYCLSQAVAARTSLSDGTYADNQSAVGILEPFISSAQTLAHSAQSAIATQITPVFDLVKEAYARIAEAAAMVVKVQNELKSGTDTSTTTADLYSADIAALESMPPTMIDVAQALQDSQAFGTAIADPAGSLVVAGGSTLDRMNLISSNASALRASCDIPYVPPSEAGSGNY